IFIAVQRCLDVKQDAIFVWPVADLAGGAMRATRAGDDGTLLIGLVEGLVHFESAVPDRPPGQFDDRAKIDARITLKDQKRCEAYRRIGFRVDRNDYLAVALQKGIDAEIFDVTAIG